MEHHTEDSKHLHSENLDTKKSENELKPLLEEETEDKKDKRFRKETIIGLLFAFLSALLTALSKIFVQALKGDIPHFQLNTMRCLTAAIGMVFVFVYTRQMPRVEYSNLKSTILYSVPCTMYGLSLYIAVVYIPLVSAEACVIATNIFSSLIIFGLFKKEDTRIDQVSLYCLLANLKKEAYRKYNCMFLFHV